MGLYSEGPDGQKGVLGSQITINVTIEKNDDPYGVVGFKSANIIKIMGKNLSLFFTNSQIHEMRRTLLVVRWQWFLWRHLGSII